MARKPLAQFQVVDSWSTRNNFVIGNGDLAFPHRGCPNDAISIPRHAARRTEKILEY